MNDKVAACFYTSSTLPVWRLSRYPTLRHTAIHYTGTLEFRYACHCSKVTLIQCSQDNQWSKKLMRTTLSLLDICNQPKNYGPCDGHVERFYYDAKSRVCFIFIYGGCGGNGNNFKTREECEDTCPACGPVCDIYCEFGNVMDANGCATCECYDPCKVICLVDWPNCTGKKAAAARANYPLNYIVTFW